MRQYAWQYILCLTLVFACTYANAYAVQKRQAEDDGGESPLSKLINNIKDMLGKLPLIGDSIVGAIEWTQKAFGLFEIGTNGAIARLLGGALPCTVSLDGTECTGLESNGGFGKVLMDVLDGLPSLLLPGFVKNLIALGIQMFIDPTVDVLFGGVVVES